MAFKMKGHTLPGIKQKAAPTKFIGATIAGITALAKAAAATKAGIAIAAAGKTVLGKAAAGAIASETLRGGVKLAGKPGRKKAKEKEEQAENRAKETANIQEAMSGKIGTKSKRLV